MISGITIDKQHSYYRYGLYLVSRNIGEPPKDDHTERVPYSNITHDFDEITGLSSYGERTLIYEFEFLCREKIKAQNKIIQVKKWLHWTGRKNLYDPAYPEYHFEVREPVLEIAEKYRGIFGITATFKANPEMQSNSGKEAVI